MGGSPQVPGPMHPGRIPVGSRRAPQMRAAWQLSAAPYGRLAAAGRRPGALAMAMIACRWRASVHMPHNRTHRRQLRAHGRRVAEPVAVAPIGPAALAMGSQTSQRPAAPLLCTGLGEVRADLWGGLWQ
jgi:hypothetical protein